MTLVFPVFAGGAGEPLLERIVKPPFSIVANYVADL